MKKLFAILMAIAMIAALSVTVFADQNLEDVGSFTDITIQGTYDEIQYEEDAYYVTLKYTPVTFEYVGGNAAWNPQTLKWDAPTGAQWNVAEADITIENRSTNGITATFGTKNIATGLEVGFFDSEDNVLSGSKLTLAKAAADNRVDAGTLQSGTVTVKVTDGVIDDDVNICTVTVAIA